MSDGIIAPSQTPWPGPGAPVLGPEGLRVAALSYDAGGEGVSWHDRSPGIVDHRLASDGGRTGSDVEVTPDGDIGWVQDGEWLEYTIEIAAAGTYDLGVLMGTKHDGRSVTAAFTRAGEDAAYQSVEIATRNTGSYASFAENAAAGIALEAGIQTLRIAFSGDDQDFRTFTLDAADEARTLSLAGTSLASVVDLAARSQAEAARILPLGDSITYGVDTPGGWRAPLREDLLDHGLWIDFVGEYSGNSGSDLLDPEHQGKSGITAREVDLRIDALAEAHPADIVTLMLGTNDVWRYADAPDTVPGRLASIIDSLAQANPGVEILLATLTPRTDPELQAQLDLINADLPDVVSEAQARGIDVTLVDMSEVGLGDLHDEVHPSAAGYELFAQIWGEAILEATDRAGGTLNGEVAAVGPEVAEVVGSEAGDRLLGDGTNDILSGMGGNDWIDGRGGADVLSGGAGRDVFAFGPGSGQDRILDFTTGAEGDLLLLAGAGLTTLSELEGRLSQRDGGLDLDLDSGDVVHLVGLAPGDLEDGNLIFA